MYTECRRLDLTWPAGRPRPVGHVPRARTWHVEKLNYERKIRAYIELWHDVRYIHIAHPRSRCTVSVGLAQARPNNHTLNRPQAEVHRMQHSGCSKERFLGTDYAVKTFVKKSPKNISTHYSIQGTRLG